MFYTGTVHFTQEVRQPELFYDAEEFDSLQEFIDTVTTLLADCFDNPEAEKLNIKLLNGEYGYEIDGDTTYVDVYF